VKTTKLIISISLILIILSTGIYAHSDTYSKQFHYTDENITIIFEDSTNIDSDKQSFIANAIVYGAPVQSRAWCWLTGHSYQENIVEAITHKVAEYAPRCWRDIYAITTCENCDYYEEELISSGIIFCCPED